ncbi:HAD family hydrolase [Natronococcus pandeyae]|uniref:HAD family hydrolase n=1 Tax=Natronococcus pandeyae TaxID=2055836 RepID=A0A8J8Q9B1_9EURY|nr:HAD family hydrolase [Natronococcus pandeyae]TYL40319.1 HAD family hydrolase [Natronococcus pandeyae]
MSSYDAVCFDLDKTICEPTQDPATLLERTFEGVDCDRFCTPSDLRAAVPSLPTVQTAREFYEHLFSEVAGRADADPTLAPSLAERYLEVQDPSAVRFRPGAAAALEHARERGQVALITNGGRPTQIQKLRALDIEDAFDVRVYTDPSAGIHPKPNAAPFERALGELEATPDAAIHVGDSLRADIAGANAMGIDSAWIDVGRDRAAEDEHVPTYELSSLERLESIL